MNDDRLALVKVWCKKADNDFMNAENTMKMKNPPTDTVCFHAQQCAEKYIKAFLVYHDVIFPKTHSLEDLVSLCEKKQKGIYDELGDLTELSSYGVWVRYPDDLDYDIPKADAHDAIHIAKNVRKVIKKYLKLQ